ncbi:DoxX family membrane protein [Bacillus massiliigorillae]|uniref:DoxX family membrane protein n=1 Tax=Bacillus massiliigorillae TaxID=1243664 RepID=UPI00039CC19A|nr:DoxX family membrane protein [Bacillus massiliigorillae]
MMNWLRSNMYASGILVLLRLYLGFQWFKSGFGKITDGFDASGFMGFIAQNPVKGADGSVAYPLYNAFIENVALPNAEIFNVLVPWGELLIGLGLILGTLTTAAAFFGLLMNFTFVLGGTVSTNPTFILLGFIILVAGANAGRFGGDYWVIPWIRKNLFKKKDLQFTSETHKLSA